MYAASCYSACLAIDMEETIEEVLKKEMKQGSEMSKLVMSFLKPLQEYEFWRLSTLSPRYLRSHPVFVRLQNVSQLGNSISSIESYSRYTHSLGVASLARIAATRICHRHGLDRKWINVCELAGLAHDIGHGKGSHLLDYRIALSSGKYQIFHEERSIILLKHIMKKDNDIFFDEELLYELSVLITGKGKEESKIPLQLQSLIKNDDGVYDRLRFARCENL